MVSPQQKCVDFFNKNAYTKDKKEHRRINARVLNQHVCHVAVAPGGLSFFAQIRFCLSAAIFLLLIAES